MAISAPANTQEKRRVVSIYDSAIDAEASDIDAYAKDYDLAHLVLKAGEGEDAPTWFTLRALSKDEIFVVLQETQNARRCMDELFRVACINIENLATVGEDGERIPVRVRRVDVPGYFRALAESTWREVDQRVREELGLMIWQWSQMSAELEKNCSART